MGHDIYGYRKVDSFHRNIWSEDIKEFYKALKAENFNAGVSGSGGDKIFYKQELIEAINYLKNVDVNEENRKDFIDFIHNLLENLDEHGHCIISFS